MHWELLTVVPLCKLGFFACFSMSTGKKLWTDNWHKLTQLEKYYRYIIFYPANRLEPKAFSHVGPTQKYCCSSFMSRVFLCAPFACPLCNNGVLYIFWVTLYEPEFVPCILQLIYARQCFYFGLNDLPFDQILTKDLEPSDELQKKIEMEAYSYLYSIIVPDRRNAIRVFLGESWGEDKKSLTQNKCYRPKICFIIGPPRPLHTRTQEYPTQL